MKRALTILLLLLTLTLWGAEASRARIAPAPIEQYDKLLLYSYAILGVEVRSFSDEEFADFMSKLRPWPEVGEATIEPGHRASLRRRQGLIITRVIPGTVAEKSGLQVGEVICSVNGWHMFTPKDLMGVMRHFQAGLPLKMWLIDQQFCWKVAEPRPEARPEAAVVGHVIPRRLCPKHRRELTQQQARAIELLSMDSIPFDKACNTLETISRLIYGGDTPGCMQIPLRAGDCSIIAIRNGWDIDVIMTEQGVTTTCALRMYHYQMPDRELCYKLPDSIRRRLLEMDTTGAAEAPYKESFVRRVRHDQDRKPRSPVAAPPKH